MKRLALCLTIPALALAASAGQAREQRRLERKANPAAVVATELAFAREAKEKGQWKAFRDYAAKDAVMFVPQPVNARDWLKKQPEPKQAVDWEPYEVWSSCDGTLAVTRGGWTRPDGSVGVFTTVWQRQKKGEYRWVLDQGKKLDEPLAKPEFLDGIVADCPARADRFEPRAEPGTPAEPRSSDDGTLHYDWSIAPGGSARHFEVRMRKDGAMVTVLGMDFEE